MKMLFNISFSVLALAALALGGCTEDAVKVFDLDSNHIEIGPEGGTRTIRINSSGDWIAKTEEPWITLSPANGRGTVDCKVIIDSTLLTEPRPGSIRIQNPATRENRDITVEQQGFPLSITLKESDDANVEVPNYATLDDRNFEVTVCSNVDFTLDIKSDEGKDISWLKNKEYKVSLDRGARPREVKIRFDWKVNSIPEVRLANVSFVPKGDVTLAHADRLQVKQEEAERIEPNTRSGDSIALLGISRALETWQTWENGKSMNQWSDVTLWQEGMEGYTPEKEGRVKYARFFIFGTKESIPYEVQYLTAAEELEFYSNANSFLIDELDEGVYISRLPQLKRLTIGAYGLSTLTDSLTRLQNLEYLNLSGNNFQKVPQILTPENFPKLHSLNINSNQRSPIYDLSNTVYTNFGGLYDEPDGFPKRLLQWEKLDTLIISVNYLHGSVPDMADVCPPYTKEEVDAVNAEYQSKYKADSLPSILWQKPVPKVLPNMKHLAINLNRLTGNVPDWILYHPALDWWIPYIFIFSQEGKDAEGRSAGFANEPANLNYYYDLYTYKQRYDDEEESGDDTTTAK